MTIFKANGLISSGEQTIFQGVSPGLGLATFLGLGSTFICQGTWTRRQR